METPKLNPKILLLTCPEVGHSNVFWATAHALLSINPSIQLHFGSQEPLRKTFETAFSNIPFDTNDENHVPPTFHCFNGPTVEESLNSDKDYKKRMTHLTRIKPGWKTTPNINKYFIYGLYLSWTPEQWFALYNRTLELVTEIEPDVVIIDGLFAPAVTACRVLRERRGATFKFTSLSPNSLKDFTHHHEGLLKLLTKWPAFTSALPAPIPRRLIPLNTYYMLRIAAVFLFSSKLRKGLAELRRLTGLPDLEMDNLMTATFMGAPGLDKILLGGSPEVDFPCLDIKADLGNLKDKLVCCGPILRTGVPIIDVDPEMAEWLKGGPVVYINLGTILSSSAQEALDMAKALRIVLDKATDPGTRVIWKLKKDEEKGPAYNTDPGSPIYELLKKEIEEDRMRIVRWIKAEPASLLRSGDIACAVTHGGASSYYEATDAGVPQVILPVWADTYDFANRVELLGIGRWGSSRKTVPRWKTSELAEALVDVVVDRHEQFAAKAKEVAEASRMRGVGREIAARTVLEMIGVKN